MLPIPSVLRIIIPVLVLSMFAPLGFAQGIDQCSDALVLAHLASNDQYQSDFRLAAFVNRNVWEQSSHDGGVNALIYGVPVGASYDDFHKRAEASASGVSQRLTIQQSHNIQWTGLDPNAPSVYEKCVDAIANQQGLHLYVVAATERDITVNIRWTPIGMKGLQAIPVSWSGADAAMLQRLPKTIVPGGTVIVLQRPTQALTLGVNYDGHPSLVELTPMPAAVVAKPPVWGDFQLEGDKWDWIATKVNNECRPSDSSGIQAKTWSSGRAENYAYAIVVRCRIDNDTRFHWEVLPNGQVPDGPEYWTMPKIFTGGGGFSLVLKRVANVSP
jgi:hypothetical protein